MTKRYYNCFSPKLLAHLLELGFIPYEQLTHHEGKNFWRFKVTEELSLALTNWSQNK